MNKKILNLDSSLPEQNPVASLDVRYALQAKKTTGYCFFGVPHFKNDSTVAAREGKSLLNRGVNT